MDGNVIEQKIIGNRIFSGCFTSLAQAESSTWLDAESDMHHECKNSNDLIFYLPSTVSFPAVFWNSVNGMSKMQGETYSRSLKR